MPAEALETRLPPEAGSKQGHRRQGEPDWASKHLLSTRPISHKVDETIRGHVFCSFLALVLKKALEDRIAALGRGSWPEIVADLDSLSETEIELDGKRFVVRSTPRPAASLPASRCHRPCARSPPTDPPSKM